MARNGQVCWIVPPSTRVFCGEFAQHDAEQEANHCGGTAKAIPLYAAPQRNGWIPVYQIYRPIDVWERHWFWVDVDKEEYDALEDVSKGRKLYASPQQEPKAEVVFAETLWEALAAAQEKAE